MTQSKVFKDRAKVTASAATSGIWLELGSVADGFQDLPDSGEFDYLIAMLDGSGWEVGRGIIETGASVMLRRLKQYAEFNPGAWGSWMGVMNFPAGAKEVSCVIAADTITNLMGMFDSPNNPRSWRVDDFQTTDGYENSSTLLVDGNSFSPRKAAVYEYTATAYDGYNDGTADSSLSAIVKQWKGVMSVDFSGVVTGESSQEVIQDIGSSGMSFALHLSEAGEFSATVTGVAGRTVAWSATIRELAYAALPSQPA